MNKIYMLFLFAILVGCKNPSNDSQLSLEQLKRVDQLLTQNLENLAFDLSRANAVNTEFAGKNYQKAKQLQILISEMQSFISNKNVLPNESLSVSEFLSLMNPYVDSVDIDKKVIDPLKLKYIGYWTEMDPPNPLSDVQLVSVIIDLKMFEYEVLDYLFRDLTSNDFNFNVLKPIVIETSNNVKAGETYEAKICLTAFDTTRYIDVMVDGQSLKTVEGYAIYTYKSNNPGVKKIKGKISFPRNSYEMVFIPFEHSFVIK